MSNEESLSIRELSTLRSINYDDSARLLIERKINDMDVSFSGKLNDFEDFFITKSNINRLTQSLEEFKSKLSATVDTFVKSAYVKDNIANYVLLTDSNIKKAELIRHENLTQIMSDYIKDEDLELSISECNEFTDSKVANLIATMLNSAVNARSTYYNSLKADERQSLSLSTTNTVFSSLNSTLSTLLSGNEEEG